ncbi:MAG TPA: hypothetical protein VFP84_22620 [Kofleriaceae bacterium]|nr:hypothetical protein [Kofleriaceae bacterium]
MTRNPTIAAFFLTVAAIVPAGWHALRADLQTDGKRLRPLQKSFTVGDVRVTLDVDRSVAMTGSMVKATLVAYSETARPITVDLTALHTSNYEGERVEKPWVPIDHETIKLGAAPGGGKPVETMIKLGELPSRPALTDSFKIYVSAHGKKPPRREGDDQVDYDVGVTEGYAAATEISGWSGNNLGLAIVPEGAPTSDAPFIVAVHVKNTSGEKLDSPPAVFLTTEAALDGTADDPAGAAVTIDDIDDDTDAGDAGVEGAIAAAKADGPARPARPDAEAAPADTSFARGAKLTRRFRITPHRPGLGKITLLASVYDLSNMPGPTTAGAKDARTITLGEAAHPTMAAR